MMMRLTENGSTTKMVAVLYLFGAAELSSCVSCSHSFYKFKRQIEEEQNIQQMDRIIREENE